MEKYHKNKHSWGIILIILGIIFLLGNYGFPIFNWLVGLWPIILIYLGIKKLSYSHRDDCNCYFCRDRHGRNNSKKETSNINHVEEEEVIIEE